MSTFAGPAEVKGSYQKIREILHPVLMAIFIFLPWIRLHDKPLVLIDISHRQFILFGFTFFSHDAPLLFYLLILVLFSIFMVTAIFGRLWCGWSCPQTVFIHGLFNKIEKLILGPSTKRQLFYKSEDNFFKKIKILSVYLIFFILCWALAHSLGAYFLGSDTVTRYIVEGPGQHQQSFIILMILSSALFFNFAFFREKLCFFICPYGRFQNALIDSNSLVVFYDAIRGEPRGKIAAAESQKKGACIDCNRCVAVCPTKIDIRQGFQLECIACGKCIDACNDVMHKIKRPLNLIRYETSDQRPITLKRFRILLYAVLIVLFAGGFVWSLSQRKAVVIEIARGHERPVSERFDQGQKYIQNQVLIHIKNQTLLRQNILITLSEQNKLAGYTFTSPTAQFSLEPDQDLKTVGFIEIDAQKVKPDESKIQIILTTDTEKVTRELDFLRYD